MKISNSVRAAMVPDDNPMHPDFTSIYLVGPEGKQSLTIDSGEALERYQWFLKGYLAAVEQEEIGIAAITHHHSDHSGNLKWAKSALGANIAIPKGGRKLLTGRIPREVDQLEDGQTLKLGKGVNVEVLATPGHSVDSLCYYIEDEGVLFTGDTLLGSSTTTVSNLGDYRRSLERLLKLPNLRVICPGHGKIVRDPRKRLKSYVEHRNMREQQVLDALKGNVQLSSWDIMMQMYPDVNPRLRRAAEGNVRSHLDQLAAEGQLTVYEGKPKRAKSKAAVEREHEHVHHREQIIKQAKKLQAQASRAEINRQENPPSEQWTKPPLYELK